MPWCPICKNEYVAGKTHCPDCDVDLVEALPEEETASPAENTDPELLPSEEELEEARKITENRTPVYQSPEEKYEDTRSSALTFLLVGGAGILVLALHFAGVIFIPLNFFALAVMGAMFLIFLGIGFVSLGNAKKMAGNIQSENEKTDAIVSWCREHLTAEALDTATDDTMTEELKYFHRSEAMRAAILEQYPEIDEALLEKLLEDFYSSLFEA